jgi:hypothetical protein
MIKKLLGTMVLLLSTSCVCATPASDVLDSALQTLLRDSVNLASEEGDRVRLAVEACRESSAVVAVRAALSKDPNARALVLFGLDESGIVKALVLRESRDSVRLIGNVVPVAGLAPDSYLWMDFWYEASMNRSGYRALFDEAEFAFRENIDRTWLHDGSDTEPTEAIAVFVEGERSHPIAITDAWLPSKGGSWDWVVDPHRRAVVESVLRLIPDAVAP